MFPVYPRVKRRTGGRLLWLRTTAIVCVTLLALASGRGLVPGLCANLSAACPEECQGAETIVSRMPVCCLDTMEGANCPADSGGNKQHQAPRDCAFCKLACARYEALEYVTLAPPLRESITTPLPVFLNRTSQFHDAAFCIRGPPGSNA